jgi:hypothetical protein
MTLPVPTPQETAEWIHENEVCFEITPHYDFYRQKTLCLGLDLTLFAKRPLHCQGGDPGCPACAQTYKMLRAIALRALPPGIHGEFAPFDASFHLRPETHWRTEVDLVVEISGPKGSPDPARDSEQRLNRLISGALEGVGVQSKVWQDSPRGLESGAQG